MTKAAQQEVRRNFEEKAACIARSVPGMAVIDHGDFVLIDSGVPSDTFNTLVLRRLRSPEHVLRAGVAHFSARQRPMALWYWDDPDDRDGIGALTAAGLRHSETERAMIGDLARLPPAPPAPDGLTITRVTSHADLRAYADVLIELFGQSDEAAAIGAYFRVLEQIDLGGFPAMRWYIAALDRVVVATGCLFVGSHSAGIYDIVTRTSQRRRGIGGAVFAHLLHEARRLGQRTAVLQAAPDGVGIYQRAGFTIVGDVQVLENRALLWAGCQSSSLREQTRPHTGWRRVYDRFASPAAHGGSMVAWDDFAADAPELAQRGQTLLFQFGVGLAFLATVRKDGAPRLHPVCPVISDRRLYVLISPSSPKKHDLLRDGRYALQAFPPPGDDATGEFYVTGRAVPIEDAATRQRVLRDATHGTQPDELIFELLLDRAMYTTWERTADGVQPVRTAWRAASIAAVGE